jgi:hypothetical protein
MRSVNDAANLEMRPDNDASHLPMVSQDETKYLPTVRQNAKRHLSHLNARKYQMCRKPVSLVSETTGDY